MDTRKGLYSYEALQTRLAENRFAAQAGVRDLSGPLIRLDNLRAEDIYVLLRNIRDVFASGNEVEYIIPDEAIQQFMKHCSEKIGEAYFRTPRNTIREFVDMLSVLEQNSNIHWEQLIGSVEIEEDQLTILNKARSWNNAARTLHCCFAAIVECCARTNSKEALS
jgi:hypothetical protein